MVWYLFSCIILLLGNKAILELLVSFYKMPPSLALTGEQVEELIKTHLH